MLLFQTLNLSDAAPVGLLAIAVAILLGVLAPALCRGLKSQVVLLVICLAACVALEVLLRTVGTVGLLQVLTCVLVPFTLGLLVGTLIQLIRQLVHSQTA